MEIQNTSENDSPIPDRKRVLIVFAQQDRNSFNGALLETAKQTLEEKGHCVYISDLYAKEFEQRPTMNTSGDIMTGGTCGADEKVSPDILSEMKLLEAADLVIFQFPLYWSSTPAIVKGWFDRVLADGFAFNFEKKQILDNGLMTGKKVILSITTGGSRSMLTDHGVSGDIDVLLWPIQYGILRMCGFDVLPPQMSYGTADVDDSTRSGYLSEWRDRLHGVWAEVPMSFPTCADFDNATLTFTNEFIDKTKHSKWAPSIGHHMNKPLQSRTELEEN